MRRRVSVEPFLAPAQKKPAHPPLEVNASIGTGGGNGPVATTVGATVVVGSTAGR